MDPFKTAVIWTGAISTLALYSILYKENPVYRFAEHVFLGIATGIGLYYTWKDVLHPMWWDPLADGYWLWILALIGGLMYYTVFFKRLAWMSRLVMMITMGLAAGLVFRQFFGTYMKQIGSSFKPLIDIQKSPAGELDLIGTMYVSFTNILFAVTLITVMTYFFFSFEQKNPAVTRAARTGRWLMMIAFGAMFGSTVMARMSLFIGRLVFLFGDWLGIIKS